MIKLMLFTMSVAALVTACGASLPTPTVPSGPGGGPTLAPFTPHPSITPSPTPPPSPTVAPATGSEVVLAPIESVEINVAESAPPQYFAHIVSGLPNGCVRFNGTETKRSGNTILVTVTNLAPTGEVFCTMVYGLQESNVALGSDFTPGETYTVMVNNEKSISFVAQ